VGGRRGGCRLRGSAGRAVIRRRRGGRLRGSAGRAVDAAPSAGQARRRSRRWRPAPGWMRILPRGLLLARRPSRRQPRRPTAGTWRRAGRRPAPATARPPSFPAPPAGVARAAPAMGRRPWRSGRLLRWRPEVREDPSQPAAHKKSRCRPGAIASLRPVCVRTRTVRGAVELASRVARVAEDGAMASRTRGARYLLARSSSRLPS
jgi:hypothetical protein